MAITKIISSKSSHNLIHYIMDGKAHDKKYTTLRDLFLGGQNIFSDYQNHLNSGYISSQFYAVRKLADKTKKKTQAFHNIYSFSSEDFPPTNNQKELQKQAKQAYKLVDTFLKKQLSKDAQYLIGIQRDGKGGMLHAHVAINSVMINGKVLDTNNLSLLQKVTVKQKNKIKTITRSKGLYAKMQDYFEKSFPTFTGRSYTKIERDKSNIIGSKAQQIQDRGGYVWKEDLKDRIVKSAQASDSFASFKQTLKDVYGVDITERNSSDGNGGKRLAYTYSFKDENGKKRRSRDYHVTKKGAIRGLGQAFRPQDISQILQMNLDQEQQQELEELEQVSNSNLKKVEVISNGTQRKPVSANTNTAEEDSEPELKPTFTGGVKAVKKISVSRSTNATDYDTSTFDVKTNQLQQQNLQEVARRQQQADANAERERRKREQERKERERQRKQQLLKQQQKASGHQEPANHNQKQEHANPEPTTNLEQSAKHIERESGFDDPDFG